MDISDKYCSFCKNKCPLTRPKCDNGRVLAERLLLEGNPYEGRCLMCEKHCPYSNLECDTGKTIGKIKGWI